MRKGADAFPILAVAVAAAVGIALGFGVATLRIDDPRDPGPETSARDQVALASSQPEVSISGEFIALQREFEAERRARESLARDLEALREQIGSEARSAAPTEPAAQPVGVDRTGSDPVATGQKGPAQNTRASAKQQPEQPWFNRVALERADYSNSEIEEIVRRFEEFEMEKLYLEDQGRRDGSFRSAGYNDKLSNLRSDMREDLGAEGYDAYLYATGKNNRVEIREVLANSPASYAGLEPGDIVISYSESRVFHPREFKKATSTGDSGAQVPLEVWRNGEIYRLSVARGPLGVRLAGVKRPPVSRW